ncbi:MAG: hypothetical protein C0410_02180, partial [Anaerolinea sp.]|nr:hypothetical protein [Anaerolinea sp.]
MEAPAELFVGTEDISHVIKVFNYKEVYRHMSNVADLGDEAAKRLASVNSQTYTYVANENLLADGAKTFTYNYANPLIQVVSSVDTYQYTNNGLGDRLQSPLNGTTTTYSHDLNSDLTQVLAVGTNTYTFGFNRFAQVFITQTGYFFGDAPRCAPFLVWGVCGKRELLAPTRGFYMGCAPSSCFSSERGVDPPIDQKIIFILYVHGVQFPEVVSCLPQV